MAKAGSTLENITHIYSHEQALAQSSHFIDTLKHVEIHTVKNTAVAAQMVASSPDSNCAALASKNCAEIYGLDVLKEDVQDSSNNYTRFACIARNLEIFPGADRTSLMLIASHKPGSLYKILATFYTLGINIIKLESRPIPNHDFEFMFYFDISCSPLAPEFARLMETLTQECVEVRYLGSYTEVI